MCSDIYREEQMFSKALKVTTKISTQVLEQKIVYNEAMQQISNFASLACDPLIFLR